MLWNGTIWLKDNADENPIEGTEIDIKPEGVYYMNGGSPTIFFVPMHQVMTINLLERDLD